MIILNESKIKYEKLDELLSSQLESILFSQQVNIIVDLKEVIKKFFRPGMLQENKTRALTVEEISSDIINIVAHYRNYFFKKGKYTNFYFLYSFNECEAIKKIFHDYKKDYYSRYFNDKSEEYKIKLIKSVMSVAQKFLIHVPNCKFIDTSNFDELIYAKYIISEQTKSNELNIILSNDPIMYQLLDKHTFMLNLKGIKSELLTMDNCVGIYVKEPSVKMSSAMFPLIISLSGNKKYTFPNTLPNVAEKKSVKIIQSLIEREIIKDTDNMLVPIDYTKLNPTKKSDMQLIEKKDAIEANYKLIRNDELLYSNKALIFAEFSKSYPVGNKNYFLDANAKIFTMYPLQLDMLLKGEKI